MAVAFLVVGYVGSLLAGVILDEATGGMFSGGGFPKDAMIGALLFPVLLLPGLLAISASVSIWLANRIGPAPGGWPELIAGIDGFGTRYGLPSGVTPWLFAASIALFVGVVGLIVFGLIGKKPETEALPRSVPRPRARRPRGSTPSSDAVFVSPGTAAVREES